MAKTVFYSFHYKQDVHRVQLVEKIGALEGQPILNSQEWESVQAQGQAAIQKWIDDQMKYKRAVVVLIGRYTSQRPWVRYEIEKAWAENRPLLGIRIHGVSSMGSVDTEGANPFDIADVPSHRIPVFDPTQRDWAGNIDSKATYNYLADKIESWSGQGATA
ncbi:TIR domain-containing protein [Curtobacterium sp. YC1]|uniref:TIR domain-containing protein n=1 Tax=Curtobacterium sp. YC1 TaxID=2795488 RepID=UPI0018E5296E|nr:TIR domain-containing protein [Curtobacterium sp. YC1]QQD76290.1 TIR domain-containing protein [Curtobacterium sp. YC1]